MYGLDLWVGSGTHFHPLPFEWNLGKIWVVCISLSKSWWPVPNGWQGLNITDLPRFQYVNERSDCNENYQEQTIGMRACQVAFSWHLNLKIFQMFIVIVNNCKQSLAVTELGLGLFGRQNSCQRRAVADDNQLFILPEPSNQFAERGLCHVQFNHSDRMWVSRFHHSSRSQHFSILNLESNLTKICQVWVALRKFIP